MRVFHAKVMPFSFYHQAPRCRLSLRSVVGDDCPLSPLKLKSPLQGFSFFFRTLLMYYTSLLRLLFCQQFLVSTLQSTFLTMYSFALIIHLFYSDTQGSTLFMISIIKVAFLMPHCDPYKMKALSII